MKRLNKKSVHRILGMMIILTLVTGFSSANVKITSDSIEKSNGDLFWHEGIFQKSNYLPLDGSSSMTGNLAASGYGNFTGSDQGYVFVGKGDNSDPGIFINDVNDGKNGSLQLAANGAIVIRDDNGDNAVRFMNDGTLETDHFGTVNMNNNNIDLGGGSIVDSTDAGGNVIFYVDGSNNVRMNDGSGTTRIQAKNNAGLRFFDENGNIVFKIPNNDGNLHVSGGNLNMNSNQVTNVTNQDISLISGGERSITWEENSNVFAGAKVKNADFIAQEHSGDYKNIFAPFEIPDSDGIFFVEPTGSSDNEVDLRMHIEDDGDASERFSMWGNSCSGDCWNVSYSEELFRFGSDGDALAKGSWSGSSLDIAEYHNSKTTEPGQVLCMVEENLMAKCDSYADTRVTGIVSTDPMIEMGKYERMNVTDTVGRERFGRVNITKKAPVALSGKVPVYVTINESQNIRPGDLLTSANKKGYATKMDEPRVGAVLGKAAESFDSTEGKIKIWMR